MTSFFKQSLLQRLGLLMATITVMAVTSMGISVVIAEMLEGHAGAINQAGSLRMQSYVVLSRALVLTERDDAAGRRALLNAQRDFDERLNNSRLTGVLPSSEEAGLRRQYIQITDTWMQRVRPMLSNYADASKSGMRSAGPSREYLEAEVDAFVPRIDAFVGLLEQGAESKVRILRAVQAVSLFLTLGVVFLTMYFMQTSVLMPLNDLLGCAEQVRRGDFTRRAVHTGSDELGRLGQAFNVTASDLSKLYTELEARVVERTVELRRSNRSLELLYHTSTLLSEDPLSRRTYRELLAEMREILGIEAGVVCLAMPGRSEGQILASTLPADAPPAACTAPECGICLAGEGPPLSPGQTRGDNSHSLLTIPLGTPEARQGVMTLGLDGGRGFEPWQRQLGEAVGRQVSMALVNARRGDQARRMALLEERTSMARELHDSLAQSLSYLKIQITRIEAAMGVDGDKDVARAIVGELREGLSSAYQQLRELLTTFRIQIDGRGLAQALEDTMREFQARTDTEIRLDYHLHGCTLGPNEEIHILQVVREALTNVIRHARAERAGISLTCGQGSDVEVIVEDDGIGLASANLRRHHYGMSIMRERTDSLGGQLDFGPGRLDKGTRITLRFTPSSVRPGAIQITGTLE